MKFRSAHTGLPLLAGLTMVSLLSAVMPTFAAFPAATGASSNAAVAQLVSDAEKAIKAGKLPLAIIDLKNASSADPRNGPVRAQLGTLLMRTGDYYSAERELRQARKDGASDQLVLPSLFQTMLARNEEQILLDEFPPPNVPSNVAPDILKARALAFLNLGQSAEAVGSMDDSLKLRRDGPGLLLRARIAQKVGALPSAMQFTDEAIVMMPTSLDGPLFKIGLLLNSNDPNGALGLADQLVAKFPTSLPAQIARIEVLMRMQKNDQAKAAVDAILAKEPGISVGVYYRAQLLAQTGDIKGAWRIAQSLPPEFVASQPNIALSVSQIAGAAGSSETSTALLTSAIGRFPQNPQLRLRLAEIRVRQKDTKGALKALEPLQSKLDPIVTQRVAALYVSNNMPSEAIDVLEKLVKSGKGTDATTLQLAMLKARAWQPDQALEDLTAAVNRKPTDARLAEQLVVALIGRGRFAEALAVADKLGSDPTQRVTSLVLRGQVFLNEHKLDDALASFTQAVQADGKSQIALYGRANLLEVMQKYDEAVTDLHAVLKLNPRNMAAYMKLAEIAARQNQDGQVRGILAQAMREAPLDPAPRLALARYLASRNDRSGALNAVNDLLKIQPNSADGVALLGGMQLSMQKKAEAVATFRRLVALTPHAARSEILLGDALYASGDKAGAVAALKTAVSLSPKSAETRLSQINLLMAEKDTNGAVASAQAYQNDSPGMQADILLGDTLTRAGRRAQARAVYEKSFAAKPSASTLLRIAQNSIADGDTKSAAESLSRWIEKNPGDNGVRVEYATLLMQQQNNEDAIRQFREVLKQDPNNVVCLNNLAWLTRDQDPSGATALASRAVALAPNSASVLDTLGWIKLKHGKAAESLPLFKRAHDISPRDGEISYHLALSLEANGNHDGARGFLKALVTSQTKFADMEEAAKLAQAWH